MVRWIGWDVLMKRKKKEIEKNDISEQFPEPIDGEMTKINSKLGKFRFSRRCLTFDGKGISLENYCLSIANITETFTFLFQNCDDQDQVQKSEIDWSEPVSELNKKEASGLKRLFSYQLKNEQ